MRRPGIKGRTFISTANSITVWLIILAAASVRMGEGTMFRRILYAFHMPLFFIISGLTVEQKTGKGAGSWLRFLRQMILAYVIPYLLWALIYAEFSIRNLGWILYGSWQSLQNARSLGMLCFLSYMFIARIMTEIVLTLLSVFGKSKRFAALFVSALLFFIGMRLPGLEGLGYPWGANIAFVAAGFILLGYSMRPVVEKLAKNPVWVILILVLSGAALWAGTIRRGDAFGMVLIRSAEYGDVFWFFANALSGSFLVLAAAALENSQWKKAGPVITEREVAGVNRATLGAYVIHMPVMQQIVVPLLALIPLELSPASSGLLVIVLTRLISGWIIKLFIRYVPQMFGMYPSPKLLAPDPPAGIR